MKKFLLIPALCLALTACENNNSDNTANTDHKDTTVVINKYESTDTHETNDNNNNTGKNTNDGSIKEEPPGKTDTATTPPPVPSTRSKWQGKMDEYHKLLCKEHNNTATASDRIRMAELSKELNDMRKNLSADEAFYFATDMARTVNMQNCP